MRSLVGFASSVGRTLVLGGAVASLWGCGSPAPPPAPTEQAPRADAEAPAPEETIAWFDGSVEEAFAEAGRSGKPVFLYWGAVWCPPCHYLRTKVFTLPGVAERLERTVAVYLDGDTERAQRLGETYETSGYPTVIVFAPDGRELSRIDSLLPAENWVAALDTALGASRPVEEILDAVAEGGPLAVEPAELRLLAFANWDQDPGLDLPTDRKLPILHRLASETPVEASDVRSRFFARWLAARASDDAPELGSDEKSRARDRWIALLGDAERRRENLLPILYLVEPLVGLLADSDEEERRVVDAWESAVRALGDDPELTLDDRLTTFSARLALATRDGGAVPEELQAAVLAAVAKHRDEDRSASEKQVIVGTLAGLLEDVGHPEEAEDLLRQQGEEAVAPWYFTSWRAGLAADDGRSADAVALYRTAWQDAHGAYSRFRWAVTYLTRRMALQPETGDELSRDLLLVLDELFEQPDPFQGGYWSRLSRLGTDLEEWASGEGDPTVLETFRNRIAGVCGDLSPGSEDRERCVELSAGN